MPITLRAPLSRLHLSQCLMDRAVCNFVQPALETLGCDFVEEDADCGERDAGECGGDLELGPDHDGHIVPGGIDGNLENEEGA